jgi:hypothetical protein
MTAIQLHSQISLGEYTNLVESFLIRIRICIEHLRIQNEIQGLLLCFFICHYCYFLVSSAPLTLPFDLFYDSP